MLRFFALLATFIFCETSYGQPRIEFKRVFAPTENIVAALEMPLRQSLCLNGRWQFQPVSVPSSHQRDRGIAPQLPLPNAAKWEKTPIKIPSPWNINTWGNGRDTGAGTSRPYVADSVYFPSYPASWENVEMAWMRRTFPVHKKWENRRLILRFEAVAGDAQVWVNGKRVGSHFDSFLPFEIDVSGAVKRGQANELLVGVRKSNLFDRISPGHPPQLRRTYPNGSNMDHLAGIWNDVWLLSLPAVRTDDAFVQSDVANDILRAQITLRNDTNSPRRVRVSGQVKAWINDAGKDVLSAPEPKWHLGKTRLAFSSHAVLIGAGKTATVRLEARPSEKLKTWTPDAPNLYGALFSVLDAKGRTVDVKYARFGWRQFTISGRNLKLNGKKLQLFGDLLHPFGPFIGSRRYAWAQLKTIKAAGGNMIRPHAQPHPQFYLDLADEMGVCVLDEAAIFGSSINLNLKADQTWTRLANHVDNLVRRDRNHASVFGWSVGNEMFAVLQRSAESEQARQTQLLADLARRPARLDPTRDWISIDGDQDLNGALPVWSRHAGIGVPDVPNINKPRMIGEHGGTYYASPAQLQEIGGEQVFESVAGRNVALGIDVYRTIVGRAKPDLAVFSPSEVAWFGLEHLPFGFASRDRLPTEQDGVWFGAFAENQPGVQIERLPPYVMTLNPGFDASLPLRRELPMYAVMQDAIAGRNAERWKAVKTRPLPKQPSPTNAISQVAFEGDRTGNLFASLLDLGVPFVESSANNSVLFLVIDAETLDASEAAGVVRRAQNCLQRGGTVWLMLGARTDSLEELRPLLGDELQTLPRRATSLVRGASDARINGFSLSDLYFVGEKPLQIAGLSGPFVQSARVLLRAPKTDWSLFEQQPESAKESSLILFESLHSTPTASLVERARDGGTLLVSSLVANVEETKQRAFWSQLWRNFGVKLSPLRLWLAAPGRDSEAAVWKFSLDTPGANWTSTDFSDTHWKTGRAPFGTAVPEGNPQTAWTSPDIWARREFSVQTLPRALGLTVHHDEDVEVFLNGVLIWSEALHLSAYREARLPEAALRALQTGRNVLAVRCHQTAGGQFLDVGLSVLPLQNEARTREHNLLLEGPKE